MYHAECFKCNDCLRRLTSNSAVASLADPRFLFCRDECPQVIRHIIFVYLRRNDAVPLPICLVVVRDATQRTKAGLMAVKAVLGLQQGHLRAAAISLSCTRHIGTERDCRRARAAQERLAAQDAQNGPFPQADVAAQGVPCGTGCMLFIMCVQNEIRAMEDRLSEAATRSFSELSDEFDAYAEVLRNTASEAAAASVDLQLPAHHSASLLMCLYSV